MQSNIFLTLFAIFALLALAVPTFAAPVPVPTTTPNICQYTCTRDAEPGSDAELLAREPQPTGAYLTVKEPLAAPLDIDALNEQL
ncbi:hypothetical protein JAAARDRAFT_198171 [Jaapia argillacea MUCL 33604]|uniref:Uncharacterized protein n=1 Tax=Jaapia argillacea MUCL 33604 TaxID=933084 RepID=A0A067PMJ6_9AGAM|nr:hypothetical protein JAAARDRAFT_198171 [Jaapia argillacea MUCL 33604]